MKRQSNLQKQIFMTQMLKLSDRKFITMINMRKTLVENVDSVYDQMIISEERRKV